ncbi:hypothetical protein [Planococcus versutus]|nr:hypothetical protein [Planococcus versutus]
MKKVIEELEELIIKRATYLQEDTSPEELAALAELVNSYNSLVKEHGY